MLGGDLSIVCVTDLGNHAPPFIGKMSAYAKILDAELIIGWDIRRGESETDYFWLSELADKVIPVKSKGYLESVLNRVATHADGNWVLRLDDDETLPTLTIEWLRYGSFRDYPVWSIRTANLWGDDRHFITTSPLWPDAHARLSTKKLATGWKNTPHASAPHGAGRMAPAMILHHKFLVKSYEERVQIARRYDDIREGGGTGPTYLPHTLPEHRWDWMHVREIDPQAVHSRQPIRLCNTGKRVHIGRGPLDD